MDALPCKRVGLLVMALAVFAPSCLGKITFERTYGGQLLDYGRSVSQTPDGGYIIAGVTGCDTHTRTYLYLLKTDSLGDTIWSTVYGTDSTDNEASSVRQTLDGGYVVVGETQFHPAQIEDVLFLKTDSLGQIEWTRTYGGAGLDIAEDVRQTADGGYIVVANTDSYSPSGEAYLIKTDDSGNVVWSRTYGGSYPTDATSCVQTADGGYVVVGAWRRGADDVDVWLFKVDGQGIPVWTKYYGMPGKLDWGNSLEKTSDGGYIICGQADVLGRADVYLIKTNQSGDSVWARTYGGILEERGYSACETFDGGYIVTGQTNSFGAGDADLYLVRTDSLGMTLWDTTFGGPGAEWANCVRQTSDSGYIVVGYACPPGKELGDVYLIKTEGGGRVIPERNAAVLSIELPPDTVLTGAGYQVSATVKNLGNVPDSFVVIATIGAYLDVVVTGRLEPALSLNVSFDDWLVPPDDSTIYTMTVCADAPGDIDTTDDCLQKTIFAHSPTGVGEKLSHKCSTGIFGLSRNEPNPFCRSTIISYSLPVACHVSLKVYDITGRPVKTLVEGESTANFHFPISIFWDGTDEEGRLLASGIYFCRLEAEGFSSAKKMILLR